MKKLTSLIVFLVFLGCEKAPNNDLFKTTDGEYASRMGNFVAKFPEKPFHYIARKRNPEHIDTYLEFHSIETNFEDKGIYIVEYLDLNEESLKKNTSREHKDSMLMQINLTLQELDFVIDYFEDDKLQGHDAVFFQFKPVGNRKRFNLKDRVEGKAILRKNRLYYVYYIGEINRRAKQFIKSFRFTN